MSENKTYEVIKNMNKDEIEEYLIDVYNKGMKEGKYRSIQAIREKLYWEVLMKTKGVGPVLTNKIIAKFSEVF